MELKPSALILPDIPESATSDEVTAIMNDFSNHLRETVIPMLGDIAVKETQNISRNGNMQTTLIKTGSGSGGDLITQDDQPIYLSLVL